MTRYAPVGSIYPFTGEDKAMPTGVFSVDEHGNFGDAAPAGTKWTDPVGTVWAWDGLRWVMG